MKLIVSGTRDGRADVETWLDSFVRVHGKPDVVHVGDARGVDMVTQLWTETRMIGVRVFYADWPQFGKAAGPRRNQKMVDYCEPGDFVLAFPGPTSKGTWDLVERARKAGLIVFICRDLSKTKKRGKSCPKKKTKLSSKPRRLLSLVSP